MEINGLIEVGQHTPMLETVLERCGKVVERCESTRIASRTKGQCDSIELNSLI
jgi:hypothetical protein